MGTRNNPGEHDCAAAAADDDPIFTLRARDPLAPIVIRLWTHMRYWLKPASVKEQRKRNEALECAQAMDAYRRTVFPGREIDPRSMAAKVADGIHNVARLTLYALRTGSRQKNDGEEAE